ncbi:MAG: hypothetical protein IPK82_39515 [Polyangiaceae bacterium]|nr:hypothetical protein [Polyangiaceae bacterium]
MIKGAIEAAGVFGYMPVGQISVIESPSNRVYPKPTPITPALAHAQFKAAGTLLQASDWTGLGNAHSHACGYGYMGSLCPALCSA